MNQNSKPKFAKKSLGQNFLVDEKAIERIVGGIPEGTPLLLEIGPGRGALSTKLFSRCQHFCLLEKDDLFAEKIAGTLFIHGSRQHHVFHADALEFDWTRIWRDPGLPDNTPLAVCANLPYNVGTEIFFRLMEFCEKIPLMVLMFQKEVAQRIAAKPGTRDSGVLSVAAQLFYDVKVQQILKPGAFRPSPKIDSAVLEFRLLDKPVIEFSSREERINFLNLVRAAFAHRRKTIENSLSMELGRLAWAKSVNKAALKEELAAVGIDGIRRAETITILEYGKLFRQLQNR